MSGYGKVSTAALAIVPGAGFDQSEIDRLLLRDGISMLCLSQEGLHR